MRERDKYIRVFDKVAAQHTTPLQRRYGLLCGHLPFDDDSVALYVSKPCWSNRFEFSRDYTIGIFFSAWVTQTLIDQRQLAYNIHAIRLRELRGYKLSAKKFAHEFRARVKNKVSDWPSVSMDGGPRTLLEGRVTCGPETVAQKVTDRIVDFVAIHHLIDELLLEYLKQG